MDAPRSPLRTALRAAWVPGVLCLAVGLGGGLLALRALTLPRQAALLLSGAALLLASSAERRQLGSERAPRLGLGALAAFALGIGLSAGLAEDAMHVLRTYAFDRGLSRHPHLFWMKPAANGVAHLALGLLLWLLGRIWRAAASAWMVTAVLLFFAVLGVLMMLPGLNGNAAMLLAGGVAGRVACSRTLLALPRRVARSLPWLASITLALAGWTWWSLRPATVVASAAPAAGARNVLLIVLDTVRVQSTSLVDPRLGNTPQLEKFAHGGASFERAWSTASWTLSSHASLFTGRLPHAIFDPHSTPVNAGTPFPDGPATLAETLAQRGWDTAGFAANLAYCSRAHGLQRGFAHYEDYPLNANWFSIAPRLTHAALVRLALLDDDLSMVRVDAEDINREFLGWLDRHRQDRPFFAFLNYFDAHDPYQPKDEWSQFKDDAPIDTSGPGRTKMPVPRLSRLRDEYTQCIAYLDAKVGALLDELRRRGLAEDTLVVITSDHGESFGEHGFVGHANSLYAETLHVPLLLSLPGVIPTGTRVAPRVSLVDLPATILDLVGQGGAPAPLPGTSLARWWREPASEPTPALAEMLVGGKPPATWQPHYPGYDGGLRAVYQGPWLYLQVLGSAASEHLFDLDADPLTHNDLVANPAAAPALAAARAALGAAR